jgi:hypothetical protein
MAVGTEVPTVSILMAVGTEAVTFEGYGCGVGLLVGAGDGGFEGFGVGDLDGCGVG